MRSITEILSSPKIAHTWRCINKNKVVQVKLDVYCSIEDREALVKFTKAEGWEHLSVSFEDITPCWDTMQEMKELFWEDDEVCFQLHPKKDDYINNHEHCLHIWRKEDSNIETPPTILVGFRKGHEEEDAKELVKFQEELGNPITYDQALSMAMASNSDLKEQLGKAVANLGLEDLLRALGGDYSVLFK